MTKMDYEKILKSALQSKETPFEVTSWIEEQFPELAVLAEIEKRIKVLQENPYENHKTICHLDSLKQSINSLEVKEVDLEKEIEEHAICMPMSEFTHESEVENFLEWAREEFRYFFELGFKTQKGE